MYAATVITEELVPGTVTVPYGSEGIILVKALLTPLGGNQISYLPSISFNPLNLKLHVPAWTLSNITNMRESSYISSGT